MPEKLIKLYNTLATIETKGESTKTMALCLNYVQQLVAEANSEEAKKAEVQGSTEGDAE